MRNLLLFLTLAFVDCTVGCGDNVQQPTCASLGCGTTGAVLCNRRGECQSVAVCETDGSADDCSCREQSCTLGSDQ